MSAELIELSGDVVMMIVSGVLTHEELTEVQAAGRKALAKRDRTRIIVIAEDFQGWAPSPDWGDLSFQTESDAKIERMAVVGDKKWKDLILAFTGKGFREIPIEYFEHGEIAKARRWLKQS